MCVCFLAGVFGPGSNEFFQGLTSVEKHALHTLGRMTRLRAFRHTHHIRTGVSLSSSSSWASQERHRHLAQSCLPCTNQPKCSPNQMHHRRELGRVYKFREGERKNGKEKEGESEREGECKRKRRGYCGRREKLRDGERKKGRHIEKERWIDWETEKGETEIEISNNNKIHSQSFEDPGCGMLMRRNFHIRDGHTARSGQGMQCPDRQGFASQHLSKWTSTYNTSCLQHAHPVTSAPSPHSQPSADPVKLREIEHFVFLASIRVHKATRKYDTGLVS